MPESYADFWACADPARSPLTGCQTPPTIARMPMDDESDDVIFKRTPEMLAAQAQKIRDQLVAALECPIKFCPDNNKIRYSRSQSEVPLHWTATGIIEAVREWSVEHTSYKPRIADALSEVGAPKVTYRQIVILDWVNRT